MTEYPIMSIPYINVISIHEINIILHDIFQALWHSLVFFFGWFFFWSASSTPGSYTPLFIMLHNINEFGSFNNAVDRLVVGRACRCEGLSWLGFVVGRACRGEEGLF